MQGTWRVVGIVVSRAVLGLAMACAGGGGGDDGSWLTFRPSTASTVRHPNAAGLLSYGVTSSRTFTAPVNVGIVDPGGVTTGDVDVSVYSENEFGITLAASASLGPGTHTGQLEVRLCHDDPVTCARPVSGSPWHVGYEIVVVDPDAYTFSDWETAENTVPFDLYTLGTQGSALVAVAVGYYSGLTEVWRSTDAGVTWTAVPVTAAPPATARFALATDGTDLYLAGGQRIDAFGERLGTYTSHVWRFDGSAWHEQTAAAPFAGREGHALVSVDGALYVLGGRNATAGFSDVWRSVDGGVSWTRLATPLPAPGATCAVPWKGGLAVTAGGLWTSTVAGGTWTRASGYAPPYAIAATHCAALNDRLYLYGPGGGPYGTEGTVSSADLATWQFEPATSYGEGAPGLVAHDGRLFLGLGVGSSYRPIVRSVP